MGSLFPPECDAERANVQVLFVQTVKLQGFLRPVKDTQQYTNALPSLFFPTKKLYINTKQTHQDAEGVGTTTRADDASAALGALKRPRRRQKALLPPVKPAL